MHVSAVLLSQLVSECQQLVQVLIQTNNCVLKQLFDASKINTLVGIALDDIKADLVQTYHGPHEKLIVFLPVKDSN